MNRRAVFAWSLAPLALVAFQAVAAPPAPPKKPTGPVKEAATVQSVTQMLDGFRWGMTQDDVIKAHNQVQGIFDKEYNQILMKMQPGVQMKAAEAERENKKISFQRSMIKFDAPVGYDTTQLKGEYSYRNKEFALVLPRPEKRRFFFYFGEPPGRLWKIYDEVKVPGSMGETVKDVVAKVQLLLGTAPTALPAAPDRGSPLPYWAWQDGTTQVRIVDRSGEGIAGVIVEDKSVLSALPQLRSRKEEDPLALDPSITAVTSGGVSDPSAHRAADAGVKAGDAGKKK